MAAKRVRKVETERRHSIRDNNTENKETEKTRIENQTTWDKTLEQLKADLPLEEIEVRLTGTTLIEVTDTAARIGVNNPFAIAWLERRMYLKISKAMKEVLGKDLDLQFVTTPLTIGLTEVPV